MARTNEPTTGPSAPGSGVRWRCRRPTLREVGEEASEIRASGHTWRVRPWIRAVAVIISLLLTVGASPFMEFHLNPDGLSPGDQALGYAMAVSSIPAAWLLAFRPYVRLTAGGVVEVRNPLRTTTFLAQDVLAVAPTSYGVQFLLRDGRRVWTIAFQDTRALSGEPRWFDLAEAVTGKRPLKPESG